MPINYLPLAILKRTVRTVNSIAISTAETSVFHGSPDLSSFASKTLHGNGGGDPRDSYNQTMAFPLEKGTFDALIFDCDGTLVDSAEAHLYSIQQALAPLGLTMTPEWYHPRHGLGPEDLLDAYEADFKVESLAREAFYDRVNEAYLCRRSPHPGDQGRRRCRP